MNSSALASRDFLSLPSHHPFAHDVFSTIAIAIRRGNAFAFIAGDRHAVLEAAEEFESTDRTLHPHRSSTSTILLQKDGLSVVELGYYHVPPYYDPDCALILLIVLFCTES